MKDLEGKYVFHMPTGVVGRVKAFYDGVADRYVSTVNQKAVAGPVLELEAGHAFVAEETTFIPLDEREVAFYEAMQGALAKVVENVARVAAGSGLPMNTSTMLIVAALNGQATALARVAA